jgi:tetratricopeptide (TPR) repeat protein
MRDNKNARIALASKFDEASDEAFIDFFKILDNKDNYREDMIIEILQPIPNDIEKLLDTNSDYAKLITAKIYFWEGNYKKTEQILKLVKDKTLLDYLDIKAYLFFYKAKYRKAKNYFSILYSATYKLDYAYKLIDCYLFLNEIDKANKLIYILSKKYPKNSKLQKLNKKISSKQKDKIEKLKNIYKKSGKFRDLQSLVLFLLNSKKEEEAYKFLEKYIAKHPNDSNAKYWYATYLSWGGDNKKALKILENIVTDSDYRVKLLIAKIYSWNGDYVKSINYLNDIIENSGDKNLKLEAKTQMGLIYFWKHDYEKAKPILETILKQKPLIEVKEALMVINGDIKPLIKKYKLLSQKNPTNLDYILRVAQFSEIIKDIDTAISYYEKYYNLKPLPKIAHSLAKLYLIKKDPYKAFSYYEYWAYQKGDADSLYELAENYYYTGYNKSALSVINDILAIDKRYKKALQLKSKILKYAPKLTQENSTKSLTDIFEEKDSKLLSVANRLYFNGFYKDASTYYKEYLLNNPKDYQIRERYGYSLEFGADYKLASGEFFLVTWYKKDCNILYHYGFSLEKSGKTKLAIKTYKEALNYAKKPLPDFIKTFIDDWKKGWESQNINRYKKFYVSKYRDNPVWVVRKEAIFRRLKFISLYFAGFSLIDSFKKGDKNYYKVKFYQQYTTNKRSDKGYKILTLECKDRKCLISKERWEKGEFIPTNHRCYNLVMEKLNRDKPDRFLMATLLKNRKSGKFLELDKTNHKKLSPIKEVFSTFEVKKYDKNITLFPLKKKIQKKIKKEKQINRNPTIKSKSVVGFKGYYFQDKPDIKLLDYGVYYKNKQIYFDVSKWRLWQDENSRDGEYLTFHYNIDKFKVGLELGSYENYSYFYPYLEYQSKINIQYFHSITGKDKKSFCAVDNNLVTKHLVFSKYKGDKLNDKMTDYWWSFDISQIDSNIELTPQFLYQLKEKSYKKIDNYFYLSGWYQLNSQPSDCYYSPDFTDSTYLEYHPLYKNLEGIFKVGYSFKGQSILYSYGFNFDTKYFNLGCLKNHSYRDSLRNYWYEECFLDVGVQF